MLLEMFQAMVKKCTFCNVCDDYNKSSQIKS